MAWIRSAQRIRSGLAFHLFEKGIITEKDTSGIELKWGDVDAIEQLVNLIGRREGIGDLMAQGSRRFAAISMRKRKQFRSMDWKWRIMIRAAFRGWHCPMRPVRGAPVITSQITFL